MVDSNRRWQWSCVCLLMLAGSAWCGPSPRFEELIPQNGFVIIDTDAGVYDAMAILMLLAYDRISVKAITCVRGNTDAITVAMNVQKTLNVVNRYDIPVHVGANYGLVHTEQLKKIFGKDGFGDTDDNDNLLMSNLARGHAAVAIAKLVTENPGKVTIICLGPLTNLAIACHVQPQLLKLARSVLIMGGSMTGIGTFKPGLEFNFEMDPEAAALVLSRAEVTSSPVVIFPVETVSDKQIIDKDWLKKLFEPLKSRSGKFMTKLLQNLDMISMEASEKYVVFDIYLAACMMSPAYVSLLRSHYACVDTQGRSRGTLLTDYVNGTGKPPNVYFILDITLEELHSLIKRYLVK